MCVPSAAEQNDFRNVLVKTSVGMAVLRNCLSGLAVVVVGSQTSELEQTYNFKLFHASPVDHFSFCFPKATAGITQSLSLSLQLVGSSVADCQALT